MSNKDRASIILKKAQLLVVQERTNEAVDLYRELIIFQENNKASKPKLGLGHEVVNFC